MRKILLALLVTVMTMTTISAQDSKIVLIDMQYIATTLPPYKQATDQLQQYSKKFQQEIQIYADQAKTLYTKYQQERNALSPQERQVREQAIVTAEDKADQLKRLYFGPDGKMKKLQDELVKPIQDKIYEAVKLIAQRRGYTIVLDRASTAGMIYADPRIDISNDVLSVLGYSK